MRAGGLRNLVSIEKEEHTSNEYGEALSTWIEVKKAWAGIYPARGTEKWQSAERHAKATHEIAIRFVPGITPKHRVRFRQRVFNIISVLNAGERNKQLKIIAEEIV